MIEERLRAERVWQLGSAGQASGPGSALDDTQTAVALSDRESEVVYSLPVPVGWLLERVGLVVVVDAELVVGQVVRTAPDGACTVGMIERAGDGSTQVLISDRLGEANVGDRSYELRVSAPRGGEVLVHLWTFEAAPVPTAPRWSWRPRAQPTA